MPLDNGQEPGSSIWNANLAVRSIRVLKILIAPKRRAPNSVLKGNGKYYVVSSLGHMECSIELKLIEGPRKLSRLKDLLKSRSKGNQRMNIDYSDSSKQAKRIFEAHFQDL